MTGADGCEYDIDPCYRTVLACLRVISDPEYTQADRYLYLATRFFCGSPPPDIGAAFIGFVSGGDQQSDNADPVMDFEFDAEAIYASFLQQYGIDLLSSDMHWVVFRALLAGINEDTPFGRRIKVRTMDESDLTAKGKAQLRKLRDMWAIEPKESQSDRDMQAELAAALERGDDPQPIIAKYQKGV
ncbi:MAG: Gp15 family bacteriophage protein [Candidatus Limiplasma sp.]|nr:Gp15 family bacteriophage protein [Candidatus Limiplasma sp.]MEA5144916.1 Gp15 family bacteriophage protein [Candidatus Limiplasma sp.]